MSRSISMFGNDTKGGAAVEQLVLVAAVAMAFAAGAAVLGRMLLQYHGAIERVLALPIP